MAPPTDPRVRASHLKELLRAFTALGPGPAGRALAQVRPETLRAIEEATRVDLLPAALNAELAEAVFAVAGETGVRRWALAAVSDSLKGFFQPLLRMVTAMADPTPTAIVRMFPRGWSGTYRGCGELSVEEPAPGRTRLLLRGAPPALRTRAYLTAVCGTLSITWELTRFTGETQLERWGPELDEASWLLAWRRR